MIDFLSKAKPARLRGTVLLRLDFNTKGDDWRMRAVLPTVRLLAARAEKVVIVSHRGRPEGFDKKFSLRSDAADLEHFIKRKVIFIPHFRFAEIKRTVTAAPRGTVFLLENLRFMKGEEKNDPKFARALASLADFYVNDAFAVSHRANASVAAITKFLPGYAGLEMEREIVSLGRAITRPRRPVALVLGGAKAADKLGVIEYFRRKADWFLLGGGPANTILALRGMDVKRSVRDRDPKDLKALAPVAKYPNVILPKDFVWRGGKILDLGPETAAAFAAKLGTARTIIWSGPLGLIEERAYAKSSVAVARAIGGIGGRSPFRAAARPWSF